jgi:EpsI family protein
MPGALLAIGAILTVGVQTQRLLPLRTPLASVVPLDIAGHAGREGRLSDDEVRVAGVSQYLMRVYEAPADRSEWFSVYVGYYEQQMQGRTIHSPKNCLPGAGWEVLASRIEPVDTGEGAVQVNRYLLQRGSQQALVLYWYQGRGRVQASEYVVKWELLRDAALRQRSDEALVRVVVPIREGREEEAMRTARQAAASLIPSVYQALPLL